MKETLYKEVQEILENDLSCAICQDIYINPLILNCSHSFCKFCVYRWLSKRPGCPQCRMIVSFQAENLALRNIINKMIQKSSPQFQTNRSTNVSQRLKDEETLEKEGVVPKLVIKNDRQPGPNSDNNSNGMNNNNSRYNHMSRDHALALSRIHERSSRLLASGDHDYVVNIGLDHNLASLLDDFNRSDSDDDEEWSYDDGEDHESPEDDDILSDDHNDVTFELGSSSEESAESSDDDENDDEDDDEMDNDDLDLDDIGLSDMESSDNNEDNEDDDADVDGNFPLESSFSDLEPSSAESSEEEEEEVLEIDDSSTEVESDGSCSSNGDYNWSTRIPNEDMALPDTESDSETTSGDETSDDLTEEYDQSDDDSRESDSSMELSAEGRYEDDDTSVDCDY